LEPFPTPLFEQPQQEGFHSQQSDATSRPPLGEGTSGSSKRKKRSNGEKEEWKKECMSDIKKSFGEMQENISNISATCQNMLQIKRRESNEYKRDLLFDELKHMNLDSNMFRAAWQYLTVDDNRVYLFLNMEAKEKQDWLAEICSG
jgi:hypothetical protein